MRSIIADLEERLANTRAERDRLRQKLDELDEEAMTIQRMIEIESAKQGGDGKISRVRLVSRNITNFILDKLSDGNIWTTEALRDQALSAGLLKDSTSPGRSTHGSLLSLMRSGKVESLGKSQWRKAA